MSTLETLAAHGINTSPTTLEEYLALPPKICMGVGLKSAAREVLQILDHVAANDPFVGPDALERNVDRYLRFLQLMRLPQFAALDFIPLVPHVGMQMVWITHLTRPARYAEDCALIVGRHVHHSTARALRDLTNDKGRAFTARLWRKRYKEDYLDDAAPLQPVTELAAVRAYLVEQTRKDMQWYPDFNDFLAQYHLSGEASGPDFIDSQFDAYRKFLWVTKQTSDMDDGRMVAPPLSIDLFWHTHMMHPVEYRTYCETFHDTLLVHDAWPESHEDGGWVHDMTATDEVWSRIIGGSILATLPPRLALSEDLGGLSSAIFSLIFQQMSAAHVCKMALVSRSWRTVSRSNAVWRSLLIRDWRDVVQCAFGLPKHPAKANQGRAGDDGKADKPAVPVAPPPPPPPALLNPNVDEEVETQARQELASNWSPVQPTDHFADYAGLAQRLPAVVARRKAALRPVFPPPACGLMPPQRPRCAMRRPMRCRIRRPQPEKRPRPVKQPLPVKQPRLREPPRPMRCGLPPAAAAPAAASKEPPHQEEEDACCSHWVDVQVAQLMRHDVLQQSCVSEAQRATLAHEVITTLSHECKLHAMSDLTIRLRAADLLGAKVAQLHPEEDIVLADA